MKRWVMEGRDITSSETNGVINDGLGVIATLPDAAAAAAAAADNDRSFAGRANTR